MNIQFGEAKTSYQGQKFRVAVLLFGGCREILSLADTSRSAVDLESARRLLDSIGARLRVDTSGAEHELQQHCRVLTKWKERKPRY